MPELSQNIIDDLYDFSMVNTVSTDSWRTLRILAETVTAFDKLNAIHNDCISIFGSARSKEDSADYKATVALARAVGQAGFGIITGGGPGIMEAANKGAVEADAPSIGLSMELPNEQGTNPYVRIGCTFRYFSLRKFMFVKYSKAMIAMPGGGGTLDEMSEALVLAQTQKINKMIILYDRAFWKGLIDWMKGPMMERGYINIEELQDNLHYADSPEEVLRLLKDGIN